jgi:hypothetical protein
MKGPMSLFSDDQITALADRFQSALELQEEHPDVPPALFGPFLRVGDLAMLAGPPKIGKSTWIMALLRAVAGGADQLCGYELRCGPVVVVTEERAAQAAMKYTGANNVHVLTRDRELPKPAWPLLVRGALRKCEREGAVLLVIDTLRWWSDLAGEQSKADGWIMEAMRELAAAQELGITVLVVHHQRKGGGRDGEGVSGNNALVGAVDVLLELEHGPEGSGSNTRQLVAMSRWPDVPAVTIFDGVGDDLRILSTANGREEARQVAWADRILDALPEDGQAISREEIEEAVGADNRKWSGAMASLVERGLVDRIGKGRKGSPYRFQRPAEDSEILPRVDAGQKGEERGESGRALSSFPLVEERKEHPEERRTGGPGQEGAESLFGEGLVDAVIEAFDAVDMTDRARA